MAFKPETIKLKKWDEVHDYAKPGWIFRGERKVKRDPKTTLERACNRLAIRKTRRGVEERLFREFRRNYHHYSTHVPKLETVLEWLSLMQHHGAPTRLLDFTYSIYIAAYFATEANDKDCAIWALDSRWALRRAASLLRKGKKCDQALDQMMKPFQEGDEKAVKPLFSEKPYVCAAWPINAFRLNQRLRIDPRGSTGRVPDSRRCRKAIRGQSGGAHGRRSGVEGQATEDRHLSEGGTRGGKTPVLDGNIADEPVSRSRWLRPIPERVAS